MGYLVNPASYISLAAFKAQANDYSLAGYTDAQLTDLLQRASGQADGIMCRSYIPTEITEEFEGVGTNTIIIGNAPLIFVKSVQLVMPGFAPFTLPVGQLLIDYQRAEIRSWSPLIFQSLGISTVFPRSGLPIIIDYAYGFGYAIPPPSWTLTSGGIVGSLPSGQQINFAVTSRTQPGESLPSAPQSVTLANQGGVTVTITPQPGAFNYRVYASEGPSTTLNGSVSAGVSSFVVASATGIQAGQTLTLGFGSSDCENVVVANSYSSGTTIPINGTTANAHASGEAVVAAMSLVAESPATNYANATMAVNVTSLAAPSVGITAAPLSDTSPWPMPYAIVEATRLLSLAILYEQNSAANRGVYQERSAERTISWRSTEGTGGRGHPLLVQEATEMLQPYVFRGLV